MKMLTKENLKALPPLGSTDGHVDPVAVVKFFDPTGSWTWYAVEFDGQDTFFGLVDGWEKELGYFSLSELSTTRLSMGLKIERDLWFKPTQLSKLGSPVHPMEKTEVPK